MQQQSKQFHQNEPKCTKGMEIFHKYSGCTFTTVQNGDLKLEASGKHPIFPAISSSFNFYTFAQAKMQLLKQAMIVCMLGILTFVLLFESQAFFLMDLPRSLLFVKKIQKRENYFLVFDVGIASYLVWMIFFPSAFFQKSQEMFWT